MYPKSKGLYTLSPICMLYFATNFNLFYAQEDVCTLSAYSMLPNSDFHYLY